LVLLVAAVPAAAASIPVSVDFLRVEYRENPLGIDVRKPRFSWQLRSNARGVRQTSYEIRVAVSEAALAAGRPLLWSSGRVASAESTQREYDGPALGSGQRCHWAVRVWDEAGRASAWSRPARWEMGLLDASDWKASWIEPDLGEDTSKTGPVPMLRREFRLDGRVARARAYVTSHGLYELHLNGQRVGDELLTPGWTSYKKRLQYQVYDVTALLRQGDNAAGALLGNGWYRGDLMGFAGRRNVYGSRLALLLQIEVTYADGRRETVTSDGRWKSSTGPILMSEIYHGETYDARLEVPGWARPAFDDRNWRGVTVADHAKDTLVASSGPPVKRIEENRPVRVFKTPGGDTVADLGQNMVGWPRLVVQGSAGTTVTLRFAEVLDRAGNFYTENLRDAKQTLRYTLKGGGPETLEPRFTFFGGRYVAVDGYPGEVTPDSLKAVVIHSDLAASGTFETSSVLLNQLQRNIRWGQKGNFVDVPTDCPQRNERMGWTGDAQAFARTAAFNYDVAAFFTKWLRDVAADQYANGSVPHVIPDALTREGNPAAGAAGWGDAAVIIPWTLYLTYGDRRILEEQYASMARWVAYMGQRAGADSIWDGDFQFADWLAYTAPSREARSYPGATTSKDLVATAFFAHSTDLLARIARVLGRGEDATRYAADFDRIRSAFRAEFVSERGRVGDASQTAYVLALQFDLLDDDQRPIAARRLAEEVRTRKHLTTGFLGTPYLCHVLSRYGYLDEAYMLLNREEYPSWLYPVKQGATTIWERWDGQKPDGTFQDASMNSFNHYAYGAIGEWMYRVMAGLDVDEAEPGYKHILIQPRPGGGLASVSAAHDTPYGKASSAWTRAAGRFELTVEVPPNAWATLRLPKARLADVLEGGKPVGDDGIRARRQDGGDAVIDVGSGRYQFSYPEPLPKLEPAKGASLSSCAELVPTFRFPNTTLSSAVPVAAGAPVAGRAAPAHCLVKGEMHRRTSPQDGKSYAIGFEMRLPNAWNGRFFYQGNGGMDGTIAPAIGGGGPAPTSALEQGFAVISSDAGHSGSDASFGIDSEARLDYGYSATAKLTPMAKALIAAAYGKRPDRSYIGGCSNGGRHVFVAMTRMPEEYDGYLAGAPGYRLPLAAIANQFGARQYAAIATDPQDLSSAWSAEERAALSAAVLARCDALDGARDGMIQDTSACQSAFDLSRDVATCGDARRGGCLSAAQKRAIASIFSGAVDGSGRRFYSSFPYDSGHNSSDSAFWEFVVPLRMDSAATALIWSVPPANPSTFDGRAYALSTPIDAMLKAVAATDGTYRESALSFMSPVQPANLETLRRRGAKVIVYHGVSDAIFSVDDTTAWHEELRARAGGDVSDFERFFRVPGMAHCAGGPSTDQFDMLTALVDWVEHGRAPESVVARARGAGTGAGVNRDVPSDWSPGRSRPLCPYPKVARLKPGAADLESADSFSCR
jgi:alpha-L-rhamnosidase